MSRVWYKTVIDGEAPLLEIRGAWSTSSFNEKFSYLN